MKTLVQICRNLCTPIVKPLMETIMKILTKTTTHKTILRFRIRAAIKSARLALLVLLLTPGHAMGEASTVKMSTSLGDIEIELNREAAPLTVQNFVDYVEARHFDGLIFHRVIPGFMIQGGGFTKDMQQRPTRDPIQNEADNGLKNLAGTLSMARTSDPDSASSQFFINLVDNISLDHTEKTLRGWGYAVFAKVTSGMDVVEKIAAQPTGSVSVFSDVPIEPVVIIKTEMMGEMEGEMMEEIKEETKEE